jgi:glucosamine--fructose-6-phosphate aminotransferase (isomerizing)
MCGIFGIVLEQEQTLGPLLTEAGRRLSYRGYDSVGCATLHADYSIDLRKDVGKVDEVAGRLGFSEMHGQRGILQLRWATFGHPSQANSQPHLDSDGNLVGAHNGNVVNNLELRQQFIAEGMVVRSHNDGESCVHAVERYLDCGETFIDAIRKATLDLHGDYAFVIGKNDERQLYAIKMGSGLVAGIGDDFTCVSSDLPSILPLTRQVVRILDGEIVVLYPERIELYRVSDGARVERFPETITESMDMAQKGGYAHFMLKEIHEQPQVARELLHLLEHSGDPSRLVERLDAARNIYLVGCGTSYHACLLGAVYFARLAQRAAIPVLAPQFIAQYGPTLTSDDVGIFVSQSGETKDVLNAVDVARAAGAGVLGLVNVIGSSLMQVSEISLPLACGFEISVPATKTFTNQVIAFLYLALLTGRRPLDVLNDLPELMEQTIASISPQLDRILPLVQAWDDLYCLGYGLTYPIALEGALKLKEITYAHCEGMLSTEFKHGPLSAVQNGYPVIFLAGPEDIALLVSGINEVTCRGGLAIAIGPDQASLRANADHLVVLPPAQAEISALLAVLPLQMLSYQLSLGRGFDPDFPRNLSKTLTVD